MDRAAASTIPRRTVRVASTLFLAAISVVAGAGCSRRGASAERQTVEFEIRAFHRRSADCDTNGACARIRIDYPEITRAPGPAARDSIQSVVLDWVLRSPGDTLRASSAEAAMQGYLDAYAKFHRAFPSSPARWEATRSAAILPSPPGICTLAARIFEFNGGAHPNTITHLASLAAATGRHLTPRDLLADGSDARLLELGEKAFRTARGLPPGASFADSGYWFKDGFHLPGEFAVTAQGLRFYFNAYEVGPYVMGPTDFTIPFGEISSLVRPDGLLGTKLSKPTS